jgi:hypothetical protein
MDYEYGVIRVENEDDLQQATPIRRPPNEILLVILHKRKRGSGLANDFLRLLGLDAVIPDVELVPFVPSKVHD